MRRPGGAAIGLGALALIASWLLGSTALTVVGVGFVLAGLWARAWSRRVARGLKVELRVPPGRHTEGDDIVVEMAIRRPSRLPVGSARASHDLGALGAADRAVRRGHASFAIERVPRGRYSLGPVVLELTEPLGLTQVTVVAGDGPSLVVDPHIEVLDGLFTDSGARHEGGVRARLRRPGGFELHAVREYQAGEPMRAVHWPSTARRAELMVKELDDVPRDDVVVVLDQDPQAQSGQRGSSSLDAAVRAAGSIMRAYAGRGRRATLQLTGGPGSVVRLESPERDWGTVLDALAGVEPGALGPLGGALTDTHFPAARAPELVVVTAGVGRAAAVLEARAREGRPTSLVAVDSPTFAGAPATRADPVLLRLAAAGVVVATVRDGDDLAAVLGGALMRSVRA